MPSWPTHQLTNHWFGRSWLQGLLPGQPPLPVNACHRWAAAPRAAFTCAPCPCAPCPCATCIAQPLKAVSALLCWSSLPPALWPCSASPSSPCCSVGYPAALHGLSLLPVGRLQAAGQLPAPASEPRPPAHTHRLSASCNALPAPLKGAVGYGVRKARGGLRCCAAA